MRKLLGGCSVAAVLAVAALGILIYFGYRVMSPMIDNASAMLQRARDAAAESERLENTTRYTPPADGVLSEAQVRRFLAVHERMRRTLGTKWDGLQAEAGRIAQQATQDARELSLAELAALFRSLGGLIVEARRAHVDALNAEQFSASEYNWVKLRAYEAAGLEAFEGIDWAAIQEAINRGAARIGVQNPRMPEVPRPDVPERNRELVKPHYDELKAWLPLTVLGF